MKYLNPAGASLNLRVSPATNPQSKSATNIVTSAIVKKRIRFPTTSLGNIAPTKIKPITKAIPALSCLA